MIVFETYGQHQPLNRQAERHAREGVPLSLSTLADQVGTCCTVLRPVHDHLLAYDLPADRLHGDDTTVPVLAKGKTIVGRCWTYVRDDQPFRGRAPPAAVFFNSRDRSGEHPQRHLTDWGGIPQADAYSGYGKLYDVVRRPGPIIEAACWAHVWRKFFVLADIEAGARRRAQGREPPVLSPIALEAVQRIDALFAIERGINGLSAEQRLAVRRERSPPLVSALEAWMRVERSKLFSTQRRRRRDGLHAHASDGLLPLPRGWQGLSHQQRSGTTLCGLAPGGNAWLFAGSDRGGQRSGSRYRLIVTAKLNDIDPQAWLANLARVANHPANRIDELLPWN